MLGVLAELRTLFHPLQIQTYVEGVMAPLGDDSLIKHLRTIHAIHAASLQLEADLKAFARKTITDQAALTTFTSTLERCREDLFVPYIDGDKYIDREVRSLQQAYQHLLQPFTEFQTARKLRAKNQGMFNKLGTATLAAAFGETSPGSGEGSQAMTLETAISVQLVSRMVRVQKEAMQRCKELSGASEVYKGAASHGDAEYFRRY